MSSTIVQFRTRVDKAKQALVDYVNAVSEISGFAYGIDNTQLPVLQYPFPTYAEYAEKFGIARSHASVWIYSILPNFHGVPDGITNFNSALQLQLSELIHSLTMLKSDPGDQKTIEEIRAQFVNIHNEIETIIGAVGGIEKSVEEYAGTVDDDAKTLQQLAQAADQAEKGDREQIQKLEDVVSDIKSTIATMNKRMTLDKFGQWDMKILLVAAGVTTGLVSGGPAGSIVVGFIGATVTSFMPIGGSPVNQDDIKRLQDEMDHVSSEIGALNTDLGLLSSIATEFGARSSTTTTQLHAALDDIKCLWSDFDEDIQAVLTQFDAAMAEWSTPGGIDATIAELNTVSSDWNQINQMATTLSGIQYDFDPNVQTAAHG